MPSISHTKPQRRVSSPQDTANQLVEQVLSERVLCSWCCEQLRHPKPEYTQALINELDRPQGADGQRQKRRTLALSGLSCSFERADDGSLSVISPLSERDPRTYHEVVPETVLVEKDEYGRVIDEEFKPSRAMNVCPECAEVDIDPTKPRDLDILSLAMMNIADWVNEETEYEAHKESARRMVREIRSFEDYGSRDKKCLKLALRYGIEKAREDT